jgi:hypothetical protein
VEVNTRSEVGAGPSEGEAAAGSPVRPQPGWRIASPWGWTAALAGALAAAPSLSLAQTGPDSLVQKSVRVHHDLNWRGTLAVTLHEADGSENVVRIRVQSIDGRIEKIVDEANLAPGRYKTVDVPETSRGASRAEAGSLGTITGFPRPDDDSFVIRDEALWRANYACEPIATETLFGRPVRVIHVRSVRDLAVPSYVLWLDEGNGFPYRVDRREWDGRLAASYRYETFEAAGPARSGERPPTATSLARPPTSLDVARQAVRNLAAPESLPGGFRLANVQVGTAKTAPAVVLQYTDGLTDVFILQTDSPPSSSGTGVSARVPPPSPAEIERAEEIQSRLDRELSARRPKDSSIVARSRTNGRITAVLVQAPLLTTMAVGPLRDSDLVRMLESIHTTR